MKNKKSNTLVLAYLIKGHSNGGFHKDPQPLVFSLCFTLHVNRPINSPYMPNSSIGFSLSCIPLLHQMASPRALTEQSHQVWIELWLYFANENGILIVIVCFIHVTYVCIFCRKGSWMILERRKLRLLYGLETILIDLCMIT